MSKMIKVTVLLLIILLAAWLTPLMLKYPGLIQIEVLGYQIQMTAITAIMITGLLFLSIWLVYALVTTPKKALRHINAQSGRKKFARGLLLLSEGKWSQAEKLLLKSVNQNPAPELSYMAAARAAISQNKIEQAEKYLDQAETHVDNPLTVDLTRCELWLKTGKTEKADQLLDVILKTYPNNPRAVHLKTQTAQQLENWQVLQSLLPKAEKLQIIGPDQATHLRNQSIQSNLNSAASVEQLMTIWDSLSKNQQQQFNLSFCHNAMRVGAYQQLTDHIEKQQKHHWDNELVNLWSQLPHNLNHRLKVSEKWLSKHPTNPHVLLCNAKLHIARKQWDQAESLLQKSQAVIPSPLDNQEINQLLGQVYQEMQQPEKALSHYQKAFQKTSLTAPDIDKPALSKINPVDQ